MADHAPIFISHRAEYGRVARELKEAIQDASGGQIEVFISEDIPRGIEWRESIEKHLREAGSLFLIYGAPYEDWSWCFYETGYFSAVAPKDAARRIYCITRPKVPAPGPLSHLQMVTGKDQLVNELIDLYRENNIRFDAVGLRRLVGALESGLFGALREFQGYPRLSFTAQDADFGAKAVIPANAVVSGDDNVLGNLFTIGADQVSWADIAAMAGNPAAEQTFMCKWLDETTRIILAARKAQFIAPQTVLIGRGGRRYRTLLHFARIQGDGTFVCEFLAIDEVGGPPVGLSSQQLSLLTSIRMGYRFRSELIQKFPNDFDALSDDERLARIEQIPRIIEDLTVESRTRGNISIDDLLAGFDDSEGERMRRLLGYYRVVQREMYKTLGLAADGKTVLGPGLVGADVERFRIAFDALRDINAEFLSRCCGRVAKIMVRSEAELSATAKELEEAMRVLTRPPLQSAA